MKKLLLTLALLLFFPSSVSAQSVSLTGSCGSGNTPQLSANWNIPGGNCNVFIRGAGAAGSGDTQVSTSCADGKTYQGNFGGVFGGQSILNGGTYVLCAGSDG